MAKIRVRVQPGAKRDEVLGFQEGVLRLKLSAPPVDGRANKALVLVLARVFDVPKGGVEIVGGLSSRDKTVEVTGLTVEEMAARLALEPKPKTAKLL